MLPSDAHGCQADINLKERRNGWDRGEPQSAPLVSGSPSVQVSALASFPVTPVQNALPGGQISGPVGLGLPRPFLAVPRNSMAVHSTPLARPGQAVRRPTAKSSPPRPKEPEIIILDNDVPPRT